MRISNPFMCAYHPFLFLWHGRGRAPSAQAFGTRTDRQKALRLVMVAQRGVRPQLDWPQKQSDSSVKWMYTAFGSVIRWCSHVFVMNTYMRAPPYAITYWPWSSTMLSLSDWRWSDHCGDASHSELPLFVILCFFFFDRTWLWLVLWLHPPSI